MLQGIVRDRRVSAVDLLHRFDWEGSGVGPIESWPVELRCAIDIVLHTRHPMFVSWGRDLRIVFNDGFGDILGPHREAAFAQPLPALWSDVWDRLQPYVDEVLAGGSIWVEDVPFRTWRSDYRDEGYFTFSYAPLHIGGEVGGLICVCTETTQQVLDRRRVLRERDRLHGLFEESPSFIAISRGPDHVYEFVNSAYEEFVGRPKDALLGRSIAEVYPEVVRTGIVGIMDEVYRTGIPFSARAVRINLTPDYRDPAGERVVNWVAHPYRDPDGTIIGLFSEGFDITEQKRAEENVRRLTSELIHVSRVSAMGTMASALAHELNQPLATITNYAAAAEMLLREQEGSGDRLRQAIGAIKDAALRAGDIIRRLRSMIERGQTRSERIRVDEVIRQAADLALLNFADDPPDLIIEVPTKTRAAGDAVQIQQVLINLVRNAAEAMRGQAEKRIRIRAEMGEEMVSICVTDTGPGLSTEVLATLFQPFNSTKDQGLGVGLSISRTIIEAHGGTISARNAPDGGCSVCFTLPSWSAAGAAD